MKKLPQEIIDQFREIVKSDSGTSGMVCEKLGKLVRKEARKLIREGHGDKKYFAELFVDLATQTLKEAMMGHWTNDNALQYYVENVREDVTRLRGKGIH